VIERPDFHARANCGRNGIIGDNPEVRVKIMFSAHAERVCEGCPVVAECERSANTAEGALYGMWGRKDRTGQQRRQRCSWCDRLFEPATPSTRMCSDECRTEQTRRLNRDYARTLYRRVS